MSSNATNDVESPSENSADTQPTTVNAEVSLADIEGCADCIVASRNQGGFRIVAPGLSSKAQVKGVVEIQVQ